MCRVYFHFDSGTPMDQIFKLLDTMQSDNEKLSEKLNISPYSWDNFFLGGWVSNQFDESALVFNIYEQAINDDILIELLLLQSNLYLQQIRKNFLNNAKEMKAFIGVNYIIAAIQLSNIPLYCDHNYFVGNIYIQNNLTRTRY